MAEQFSWVPLPYCCPPRRPFPIKSLALSAHVSPRTIHFRVLDKSPVSGPGRGSPSCNSRTYNPHVNIHYIYWPMYIFSESTNKPQLIRVGWHNSQENMLIQCNNLNETVSKLFFHHGLKIILFKMLIHCVIFSIEFFLCYKHNTRSF